MAACKEGKPQWGDRGPQNAGCYNSLPPGVPFFLKMDRRAFFLIMAVSSLYVSCQVPEFSFCARILACLGFVLHI